MSKLEQLINELCPNGVEFKKIKNSYTRIKGTPITAGKMKEIASDDGEIKIFAGGKTVISAHEADIPNANITRVPAVLVQSRGVIDAVYYDRPFTFKNEMWAYTADNPIKVKYLYYVLKNNIEYFREAASGMGSLPQISLRVTEDFIIPFPPIPIQEEIVRILDKFTELTAELTTELTTELTARKQQYEYYRDRLFANYKSAPKKKLIEVADISRGIRVVKKQLISNGNYPVYQNSLAPMGYYDKYNCNGNTTYVISAGAAGEIGYCETNFWAADDCLLFSNLREVKNKYIYYFLLTKQDFIYSNVRKASIPRLSRTVIENLQIPIISIDDQEQVINLLNRFEKLCYDISEGLPAEIEARQKQYEYYRDKLLTFKKKEATENE